MPPREWGNLFGVLGGFILFSAFFPAYRGAAMVMAGVSMVGYLYLAWAVGGYNDAIRNVGIVDTVGIVCLLAAAIMHYRS